MPFEKFDRSRIRLKNLDEREHDLDIGVMLDISAKPETYDNPKLVSLAVKIAEARKKGAPVIMMMGAHVIRSGLSPWLIKLMEEKIITHFALNGAGAIHDFEFAMIGATTESVARYISEGQFGLWKETGYINDFVNKGAKEDLGLGESLGKAIEENDFKFKEYSLLRAGFINHVPVTVHVGIGLDIVHQHPNFNGSLTGKASYDDFLIFAKSIEDLEGGVFINAGSAVTGPEVYLKALSIARNVAHNEKRRISCFTTAVFDLLDIDDETSSVPKKSDPRYYFRPWKTILSRTTSDGGESYYIKGEHKFTISNLAYKLLSNKGEF